MIIGWYISSEEPELTKTDVKKATNCRIIFTHNKDNRSKKKVNMSELLKQDLVYTSCIVCGPGLILIIYPVVVQFLKGIATFAISSFSISGCVVSDTWY